MPVEVLRRLARHVLVKPRVGVSFSDYGSFVEKSLQDSRGAEERIHNQIVQPSCVKGADRIDVPFPVHSDDGQALMPFREYAAENVDAVSRDEHLPRLPGLLGQKSADSERLWG